MADKTKKVGVAIKRERRLDTKTVAATAFKLRWDKATSLVDIFFEVPGQKGERVSLDPAILFSNLDVFKKYSAGMNVEADDAAQKEDILVSEERHYANMLHCSNMGYRTETIFGAFSFHDWVEAARSGASQSVTVASFDRLAVFGTSGFQKKLLLELILLAGQLNEPHSKV